jgi:hypothetical protein
MTRSFLKLSFLSLLAVLVTGCAGIGAAVDQAALRALNGALNPQSARAPVNYAGGQQQQAAPPGTAGRLAPADECRRRHPGIATGGFRFGANGELQCQTGTTQQPQPIPQPPIYRHTTPPVYGGITMPQPLPPGQRAYPQGQQQQQAAPARAGGYECRFLRGQTCY